MKFVILSIILARCGSLASCRSASETGDAPGNMGTGAVVLALSTDVAPPGVDGLEIRVLEDATAQIFAGTYRLPADVSLPGTLTLSASNGGEVGPSGSFSPGRVELAQPAQTFTVIVRGDLGGAASVERTAVFTMPATGVKRLELRLEQACSGVVCKKIGQTCINGGCAGDAVDTSTLPAN